MRFAYNECIRHNRFPRPHRSTDVLRWPGGKTAGAAGGLETGDTVSRVAEKIAHAEGDEGREEGKGRSRMKNEKGVVRK